MIFNKIYRKFFDVFRMLKSKLRILHLKVQYPNMKIIIGANTYIGKNCSIVCVDGGDLTLNNVSISDGTYIVCQNKAKIEMSNCFLGRNCVVVSLSSIVIKDNCEIAEMVVIRDQDHKYDLSDTPIKQQGYNSASILINENVWIGAKATVLKGVEIGKNSVVGAHSVVNKSFEQGAIIVGIPAKKIN